jgi:dTDP-4-amino-4,6-dideoxygalactose transaminase
MSVSAAQRHLSVLPPAEEYLELGFNYRMTDVQAAIGIVQLDRLSAIVERRRDIAACYRAAFADVPGLRCVSDPEYGRSNFQSFWIEIDDDFMLDRESLLEHLASRDISARRGIMAAHRQPAYAKRPHAPLPVTERLTDRSLVLPVYHQMTADDQQRVIVAVRSASGLMAA